MQANPPFGSITAALSGNNNKILRALPDAQMAPSTPKDTIPADVSTLLPETPFIHFVQPNALGFVVQAQGKYFPLGQPAPLSLVISAAGGWRRRDAHSLHHMWTNPPDDTESPLTYKVTVGKRFSDDTPRSSRETYDVKDAVEAYADTALLYQVQGLCPNSSYRCSVTAISLSGDSTASTSVVFMMTKAPPSHLQPPHLLAHSAVTIQVGWQSPSDNGSLISGYKVDVRRRVQVHAAADHRYVVETGREIDVGLSLSCQVLGLSPDSMYEFSVSTESSLGVYDPSTCAVFFTSKVPPSLSMAPYLLERDSANVRVGWGFPVACQGSHVESFTFQYIRLNATCLEINGQIPDSCTWETIMDDWTHADESLFENNVESPEEATWSTDVESVPGFLATY